MWWNQYVGTPFQAHGRDISGCDCWGLVRLVLRNHFAVNLPEYLGYSSPEAKREVSGMIGYYVGDFVPVFEGKERPGDLVLIKIGGVPCHIGIVTEPGSMLHIMDGIGATVEAHSEQPWKNRVEGIYRYEQRP